MHPEDQQRLVAAFAFALDAHGDQKRKGNDSPYASHLFQVAGLVQEYGGDVEQTMAALLHDTIEDSEDVTYERLEARFGRDVADIVRDCTDTLPGEKPGKKRPWKIRKTEYLEHLKSAPPRSVLVCVCDKLHNISSTVLDTRLMGLRNLERFNAPPEEQLWYFESVLEIVEERVPVRLRDELRRVVREFRETLS